MSENKPQNKKTDKAKHLPRYFWPALLIVLAVAIVCWFILWKHLWDFRSIDEQLAAIEAARAIPDAENAVIHYTRFLTDPNNASILDDLYNYVARAARDAEDPVLYYTRLFFDFNITSTLDYFYKYTPSAYSAPWPGSEHPQLVAKLKTYRTFIRTLLDISEMQEARFPVYPSPGSDSFGMLKNMRKVVFVLSCAAANDLAEDRAEEAHSKYRCQLQLAHHLQQQPAIHYRNVGIAIEAVAFGNIKRAVMRDDITPERLRSLENILRIPLTWDEEDAEIVARVDRLIEEKKRSQLSFPTRFQQWLSGNVVREQLEQRQRLILLRLAASRQAGPILIALRRHKDKTGTWPETLEQIEPKPPEQMLTDPQNNGPFVYKRDGDEFILYSKGPNAIDEGGSSSDSADDWPIWPTKIK